MSAFHKKTSIDLQKIKEFKVDANRILLRIPNLIEEMLIKEIYNRVEVIDLPLEIKVCELAQGLNKQYAEAKKQLEFYIRQCCLITNLNSSIVDTLEKVCSPDFLNELENLKKFGYSQKLRELNSFIEERNIHYEKLRPLFLQAYESSMQKEIEARKVILHKSSISGYVYFILASQVAAMVLMLMMSVFNENPPLVPLIATIAAVYTAASGLYFWNNEHKEKLPKQQPLPIAFSIR